MNKEFEAQKIKESFWSNKKVICKLATDCRRYQYIIIGKYDNNGLYEEFYAYIAHENVIRSMHATDDYLRKTFYSIDRAISDLIREIYIIFDDNEDDFFNTDSFATPVEVISHDDNVTKAIEEKFEFIKKQIVPYHTAEYLYAQKSLNTSHIINELYWDNTGKEDFLNKNPRIFIDIYKNEKEYNRFTRSFKKNN